MIRLPTATATARETDDGSCPTTCARSRTAEAAADTDDAVDVRAVDDGVVPDRDGADPAELPEHAAVAKTAATAARCGRARLTA